MKNLPTLRQLQYFLALAETLHFSEAAKKCHVTQSTLSAGIRDLEIVLGTPIAERSKRQVRLTATGRMLLDRTKDILRQTEYMMDAARAETEPLTGTLRLGIIPTIAPYLLPAALPAIRSACPKLKLVLIEDESANIVSQLANGALDCILYALPYPTRDLAHQDLFSDPFYLAVPPEHKLAQRSQVSISDFQDEPMLLLNQGHCLREHALSACSLSGHERAAGFDGASLNTILQMVAGGTGVTLLPEMAVQAGIAKFAGLRTIPLDDGLPARTIALAWRSTSPNEEEFKLLGGLFARYHSL
jgi:LysR family hydrogen peroxide-inducible transcriptional activator